MKFGLVIPTNRPNKFYEWFKGWEQILLDNDVMLYIVEDCKHKQIELITRVPYKHYDWTDINEDLEENSWVIPRQCDSVRSYGFLQSYKDCHDFIVTLDDDVLPFDNKYFEWLEIGFNSTRFTGYFDIGDEFELEQPMRGYPFKYRSQESKVMLQYGGWDNVPDFDAITQSQEEVDGYTFKQEIKAVPKYLGVTGCIMNACWRREFTPVMYQLLMGKGHPYSRWGDIWSGLFAKKVLDTMNQVMVINGYAKVIHTRASNVQSNLEQECSGYGINERLWDDLSQEHFTANNYKLAYLKLANAISCRNIFNGEYTKKLKTAMKIWVKLFE